MEGPSSFCPLVGARGSALGDELRPGRVGCATVVPVAEEGMASRWRRGERPVGRPPRIIGSPFGAWAAILAPAALALAVYLPRVCPTLALIGDSAELVTAGAVGGVAHAPGFPLYTLMAGALAKVPLLELPWRINLSSALLHGATVGVVAAAVLEITGSPLGAVAGALALALARAFIAGLFVRRGVPAQRFLLRDGPPPRPPCSRYESGWPRRSGRCTSRARRARRRRRARFGQPTNHRSERPSARLARRDPARAHYPAAPGEDRCCTGSSSRLPLQLATGSCGAPRPTDPPLSWGDVQDLPSLWRLFLRADYWDYFHRRTDAHWDGLDRRLVLFGSLSVRSIGVPAVLAAIVGLVTQSRQTRQARLRAAGLAVAFLASGPAFALLTPLFAATSPALIALAVRFVSMPLIPLAILAGCGVAAIERAASAACRPPGSSRPSRRWP